jgi:hypothetical protein
VAADEGPAADQPFRAGFLGKRFRAQDVIMQLGGRGVLDMKGRAVDSLRHIGAGSRSSTHSARPNGKTLRSCGYQPE